MSTQLCYIANDLDRQEQSLLYETATFPDAILCIGLDPGVRPFENTHWLWCSSLSWLEVEQNAALPSQSTPSRPGCGRVRIPARSRLRRRRGDVLPVVPPPTSGVATGISCGPPPPQASSDDLWLHAAPSTPSAPTAPTSSASARQSVPVHSGGHSSLPKGPGAS